MGPIIILDKSAFQAFSRREHLFLDIYFMENLTPILGLELLADLQKQGRGSKTAEEKVAELAAKFGGSGPATNIDYRTLSFNSLLGNNFPLAGRIIPQNQRPVRGPDGSRGMFIDLSPLNRAILRWSCGKFEEFEHDFAGYWRVSTRDLDPDAFSSQLDSNHVVLPKANTLQEVQHNADTLLTTITLQEVWLSWLLTQLSLPKKYEQAIWIRWKRHPAIFLKNFSPYSWHCLRVLLMLIIATRYKLVTWDPTNLLDIQYLYYLPFCMVFASDDHIHCALGPLLLRPDQSFVIGRTLKEDLRRLADYREGLTDRERQELEFALGSHPPPARGSVVHELWKKHCLPWRPGSGNTISSLSENDRQEATQWVKRMFIEVEGETYFEARQL